MPDTEKVINKVTAIVADMQEEVDEWKDYSDSELRCGLTCDCDWWYKTLQTLKDALALLKAQEADETQLVRHYSRPNVYADLWLHCEKCGGRVDDRYKPKFCPECGRAVKWE